jgi:RNA polymerase sigma-70 factor, ECF subfamily
MPPLKDFPAGSDVKTVQSAQLGGAEAFERIYQMHKGRVYWLCLRMVHNPREAEDLTQEAFLSVFRKIHTFRGESRFSTWLYRIAFNTVLMHFRKAKKEVVSLETFSERDWELTEARRSRRRGQPFSR